MIPLLSPIFRNNIENIIKDTKGLCSSLAKEVKNHIGRWEAKLSRYRNIYGGANKIKQMLEMYLQSKSYAI